MEDKEHTCTVDSVQNTVYTCTVDSVQTTVYTCTVHSVQTTVYTCIVEQPPALNNCELVCFLTFNYDKEKRRRRRENENVGYKLSVTFGTERKNIVSDT